MELFWKAVAGCLIALVLILVLEKQGKDMAVLVSIAVCVMCGLLALELLKPVLDFLYTLQGMAGMEEGMLEILLKLLGTGLVCELAANICGDAGWGALGKSIQFMGSAAMLYLSIPVLRMFTELIQEILGGI